MSRKKYKWRSRLLLSVLISTSLLLLSGCDNRADTLARAAEVCQAALRIGDLITAEQQCQLALGDPDKDELQPAMKSQRLFQLAKIKRQQNKFTEAESLLNQSLQIEDTLKNGNQLDKRLRLTELAIVLAGQKQWEKGAAILQQVFSQPGEFSPQEQKILLNTLKAYIQILKNNDPELAKALRELEKQVK